MDFQSLVKEFNAFQYGTRAKNENAELCYTLWAAQQTSSSCPAQNLVDPLAIGNELASVISAIREEITEVLSSNAKPAGGASDQMLSARVSSLEDENKRMKTDMKELKEVINKLQAVVNNLTKVGGGDSKSVSNNVAPAKAKKADDEIDLFGSDEEEEDEEAAKIREQRLNAYNEKKSKKPGPIAKSSVILDVKPWDDETNMEETEKLVRGIEMDGLLWGASKLVPVGYGIKKLQIMCVVEDDKVSVEELQEKIESNEDYVQSVDIAAFNKI